MVGVEARCAGVFAGAKGVCLRQGVSRSEGEGWSWGEGYLEMGISRAGQVVVWGRINPRRHIPSAHFVSLCFTLASGVAGTLCISH